MIGVTNKHLRRVTVGLVAMTLLVTACGAAKGSATSPQASPTAATSGGGSTPTDAALQEAKADAGGKTIGGTLSMVDQLGGFEQTILQNALKPFEEATGITINYTNGQNYQQIVQTRVAAGDPPDVVNDNGTGNMALYAKQHQAVPLSGMVDMAKLKTEYNASLLNAFEINGTLYGLPAEVSPQMVFYNAKTYTGPNPPASWSNLVNYSTQVANAGSAPWCMALSASAQTGWPAAYFIEELFAKTYGAAALNKWGLGQISFTSSEVKTAFQEYGQIFSHNNMVSGGVAASLAKPIAQGPLGLYSTPQKCQLFAWGVYAAGIAESQYPSLKPLTDINFFSIPAVNAKYSKDEQASGWSLYAFRKTPQVSAFVKYYSSEAFQALLGASGEWVVANNKVNDYPNEIISKAAAQLADAKAVGFGPYFSQTTAVKTAYITAITDYLQNPSTLDQDLAAAQAVVQSSGR